MNGLLDLWAAVNTLVIMFALGLSSQAGRRLRWSWPMVRVLVGYNFAVPGVFLAGAIGMDWFSPEVDTGLALCIAAAGGTSAGAFVLAARGSAQDAAVLILLLIGLSLGSIAAFSGLNLIRIGTLSLWVLTAYLLAITLIPLLLGRLLSQRMPSLAARLKPVSERLGSWMVILLVLTLAGIYGVEILTGPIEPLLAGALLVLVLILPPHWESAGAWRRTVLMVSLIRNLSLALALLAVMPNAAQVLPTVLAFGLSMYLAAGVLLWRWRSKTGELIVSS